MAAGPLAQAIIDKARLRVAEPYPGMINDADIATFITEAQRDLVWRLPYQALWFTTDEVNTTIVADQSVYTFEAPDDAAPDFVWDIEVLWKAVLAKRWEVEDIKKMQSISDLNPSDTQPFYAIFDNGIEFFVGAVTQDNAEVFTVRYVVTPVDVDIGLVPVEPVFTRSYFPAIEEYVAMRCYEQRRNIDERNNCQAQYEAKLTAVLGWYERGQDTQRYQSAVQRP